MFIDICEIKGKYRGPDRDVNLSLFCLTENYKLDYELYCNFCNYNLEYNGEIEILNSRLDLVNKLNKIVIVLNYLYLITNLLNNLTT